MAPRFLQTSQHKLASKPSSSAKAKAQETPKFKIKQLRDDASATPEPDKSTPNFAAASLREQSMPMIAPNAGSKRQPPRFTVDDGFATPGPAQATKERSKPGSFDVHSQFSETPSFGPGRPLERPSSPKRPRLTNASTTPGFNVENNGDATIYQDHTPRQSFATPRRFVVKYLEGEGVEADDDDDDEDTILLNDVSPSNKLHDSTTNTFHEENAGVTSPIRPSFLASHSHHKQNAPPSPLDHILEEPIQPPPQVQQKSPLVHRPIFLAAPSPLTQEVAIPLPTHFSPHRRGAKYLAGGMAEEMTRWLMDTRNFSSSQQQMQHGVGDRGGGDELVVRVMDISGVADGDWEREMMLVRGVFESSSGVEVSVCLPAGSRIGGEKRSGEVVRSGSVLVLRGLRWDVEIAGEVWVVGTGYSLQ